MPNLGSRLTGVPIDTRGGVEGEGLVVRDGVYVNERVAVPESSFSGASVYKSTDQLNLTDGAVTKVTFDTVDFDTGNYFDDTNDRFVVPVDGHYRISGLIGLQQLNSSNDFIGFIRLNGSNHRIFHRVTSSSAAITAMNSNFSFVMALDATDFIELFVQAENSTSTTDVRGNIDQTRMSIERVDEGTLFAGFSPILDHKPTTDTLDDEFDATTLDAKWTAVTGSSGTVSLTETSNVTKFDLTTRPGTLLIQAGRGGTQDVELRQDITLADGESVVMMVAASMPMDDTGPDAADFEIGVSLNDNDTGPEAGNFARILVAAASSVVGVSAYDGTTVRRSYTTSSPTASANDQLFYLRIVRSGTNYRPFFSRDGQAWSPLGGGFAVGATLTNVWIYARNDTSYTDAFIPIAAVDWIRQGTNALDPWSHSGLVQLEQQPGWVKQFAGSASPSLDGSVYWSGSDLTNFTEQTVSGTATWTEQDNLLSALLNNQTSNDVSAQLQPVTFTIGDEWVTVVLGSMIIDGTMGNLSGGIIFSDGTATSSNCVVGHIQIPFNTSANDPTDLPVLVGRHGTLTAVTTAPWVSDGGLLAQQFVYMKLIYQASNSFRLQFSHDGVSWSAFGESDISKTMTPTHVGPTAWRSDAVDGIVTFGPLRKIA